MRSAMLLLLALVTASFSTPAWAQPAPFPGPGPGPGEHFPFPPAGGEFPPMPPMIIPPLMMGMRAAHLTTDQQNRINQILQANRSQTAPLLRQLQSVHEQIADKLLAAGTVNASDLSSLEDQAAKLDAQIQRQALNASVQIRSILTSDQVSRMAEFHQKMTALHAQMRSLMNEASPEPAP